VGRLRDVYVRTPSAQGNEWEKYALNKFEGNLRRYCKVTMCRDYAWVAHGVVLDDEKTVVFGPDNLITVLDHERGDQRRAAQGGTEAVNYGHPLGIVCECGRRALLGLDFTRAHRGTSVISSWSAASVDRGSSTRSCSSNRCSRSVPSWCLVRGHLRPDVRSPSPR
jgi:hypothetical protein